MNKLSALHEKEMVLPAAMADALRTDSRLSGYGAVPTLLSDALLYRPASEHARHLDSLIPQKLLCRLFVGLLLLGTVLLLAGELLSRWLSA